VPKKIFLGRDNKLQFVKNNREVAGTLDGETGLFSISVVNVFHSTYDVAVDGGEAGDIILGTLPEGALFSGGVVDVEELFAGSTLPAPLTAGHLAIQMDYTDSESVYHVQTYTYDVPTDGSEVGVPIFLTGPAIPAGSTIDSPSEGNTAKSGPAFGPGPTNYTMSLSLETLGDLSGGARALEDPEDQGGWNAWGATGSFNAANGGVLMNPTTTTQARTPYIKLLALSGITLTIGVTNVLKGNGDGSLVFYTIAEAAVGSGLWDTISPVVPNISIGDVFKTTEGSQLVARISGGDLGAGRLTTSLSFFNI
jgi:hypothetical protein